MGAVARGNLPHWCLILLGETSNSKLILASLTIHIRLNCPSVLFQENLIFWPLLINFSTLPLCWPQAFSFMAC